MPKSLPMLDPNETPALGDLLYTVKDTGLPDRDRKLTLLELLQAYLSGAFEDLGTLEWEPGQPITNIPAWRNQYPSGDLEQGWLNLRHVIDPVSSVGLEWSITTESPVVALESYTQNIRVAASGNTALARSFTLTGTPKAGQEIWFFIGTDNLATAATIKHGTDTLATVRGGELVRVYTLGTALVAQVLGGSQNLGRASDLTWLTGPLLEQWFTGLGWTDATHPGWTGDQLLTVLNAFGPTYQEAATSAAAARRLSEELSGSFNLAAEWVSTPSFPSHDAAITGRPCRAVRVRGYAVDQTSPTTDAALSLEMGLPSSAGGGPVEIRISTPIPGEPLVDYPLWALFSALHSLDDGATQHLTQVGATFTGTSGARRVTAVITTAVIGTVAEISLKFREEANTDTLEWSTLQTWFPTGTVVLALHTNFTIPAPPAA